MRVLVTGGAGRLGRRLVPRLLAAGHDVCILARQPQDDLPAGTCVAVGDLVTGEGLVAAVAGAETVVHAAPGPWWRPWEVDVGTSRLVAAAEQAGAPHLVVVSVVGIDRSPLRHHQARAAVEERVAASRLPWSIQRITELDERLAAALESASWSPVIPVPRGVRLQPVAGDDVAQRLVALVRAGAAGRVPDLGGPEVRDAADLARAWRRLTGWRGLVASLPVPGRAAAALRSGINLVPDRAVGTVTWEEHLRASAADRRRPAPSLG